MRCGRGSKYTKRPGKCTRPKYLSKTVGKWGKRHLGNHDLARRVDRQVDRQVEALIWCTKCSGCARQRMEPQFMDGCTPEQVGTKEHGKMLNRVQILENGRVPAEADRGDFTFDFSRP